MPANTQPIFPLTPNVSWTTVSAANTAKDGTGAVQTVLTAGVNGARVDALKVKALGTNVATVLRLFINNGGVNSTPTNNSFFKEISLPATTLTETDVTKVESASTIKFDGDANEQLSIPAGYKLNVVLGTAVAAGYQVTAIGGDY